MGEFGLLFVSAAVALDADAWPVGKRLPFQVRLA